MSKRLSLLLAIFICLALLAQNASAQYVSKGKSYTVSPAPASNWADNGNYLTDGQAASGVASFWGVNNVGWSDLDGQPIVVTVDLGAATSGLTRFEATSYYQLKSWIVPPTTGTLELSLDGSTYTKAGDLGVISTGNEDEARPLVYVSAAPLTARYVKFTLGTLSLSAWTMLSEVKVQREVTIGHNVAPGASYQFSTQPSAGYEDTGNYLTDGIKPLNPQSFFGSKHVGWADLNGAPLDITLDLGSTISDLSSFNAVSYAWSASGILEPTTVTLALSTDGVTFTPLGAMNKDTAYEDGPCAFTLEPSPAASARFVRFSVQTADTSAWTMFSELEVYRAVNQAKSATYTVTPDPSINYADNGNYLTDGLFASGSGSFFNANQLGWDTLAGTPVEVVVDLGRVFSDLEQFVGVTYLWSDSAIALLVGGTVSTSLNGTTFTPVGEMILSPAQALSSNTAFKLVAQAAAPVDARYVKFAFNTPASGWTMLSEVQVLGGNPPNAVKHWALY